MAGPYQLAWHKLPEFSPREDFFFLLILCNVSFSIIFNTFKNFNVLKISLSFYDLKLLHIHLFEIDFITSVIYVLS